MKNFEDQVVKVISQLTCGGCGILNIIALKGMNFIICLVLAISLNYLIDTCFSLVS